MGKVSACDNHKIYKAGCPACQQLAAARNRRRTRQKAYGTFQPGFAPTNPAQLHIDALCTRHGMSWRQISEAAQVGRGTVDRIANGTQAVASTRTIAAICAVKPDAPKGGHPTSALGASRRLQALAAIGYDTAHLTEMLGVRPNDVRRWRRMGTDQIRVRYDRPIRDLYERLAGTPGPSGEARRTASRMGYAPPHAWDDDTIDDPDAGPDYGNPEVEIVDEVRVRRVLNGHARISTLHRAEQVELWLAWSRRRREECLDGPGLVDFGKQYGVEARWVTALRKEAGQTNTTTAASAGCATERKAA